MEQKTKTYICVHDAERSRAESKNSYIHDAQRDHSGAENSANSQRTLSQCGYSPIILIYTAEATEKSDRCTIFIYVSDRLQDMENGFYKPVAEIPTEELDGVERKLDGMENVG